MDTQEKERLDGLEAKLDAILAKIEQAEQMFAKFAASPMLRKMFGG